MPIKRILFPTDFSEYTENSFSYAVHLAAVLQADVYIFHNYRLPQISSEIPDPGFEEEMKAVEFGSLQRIEEFAELGEKIEPAVQFEFVLVSGNLLDNIEATVKNHSIDLIVMSTKGAGQFRNLFSETKAARIIEKASCPVLVIPRTFNFSPIKNILFPSDFYNSDIKSISLLASIASPYKAKINIAHFSEEGKFADKLILKEFEKEVRNSVSYPDIQFSIIEERDMYKAIQNYSKDHNIDLVVMSTRQRNKIEKLYDQSLTQKMATHGDIPVLAFHVDKVYETII
jgi:nucleotide-binding universal stress UspA family protein